MTTQTASTTAGLTLSGVTPAELRTMITDVEAMRDLYADKSAYHFGQYDESAKWLREQLRSM